MRIFVTGGTGFIGRPLIRLLVEQGHCILVLTRSLHKTNVQKIRSLQYIQGDLRHLQEIESAVKNFRPEIFIHLAWEGLPDYSLEMCRKNLESSLNTFSLAVKSGCACILSTGSCWEYAARKGMLKEEDQLDSSSLFPAVKNAIRCIGEAIAHENGLRFYWLRLFFVYGPGQRRRSLIPSILEALSRDEIPRIQTPQNRHDFIFVDDVARAIASVIQRQPKNTVYNVGSGYSTAVEEIIKITCNLMNKTFDKSIIEKKQVSRIQNFWADISLIQKDIGWQSVFDIATGIRTIIENEKI